MKRASILAVTSELPWPLNSGGHLRSYHLLRTFAARFDVRLVVPTAGGEEAGRAALERAGIRVHAVAVPPRRPVAEALKIASAALRGEPYVMYARHRRRSIRRALRDEVRRQAPDVLYLDHLDSLVYADTAPGARTVIDLHNVYSHLLSRTATETPQVGRRMYLGRESLLLARKERAAARAAHTLITVSDADARYFESLHASCVVVAPNGVDCDAYEHLTHDETAPPTILYVGSLEWPPNVSAARFLALEVLPAVRARIPGARLSIVGKNPTPEVLALAGADRGVEVAGSVPDVAPYFRSADVLAVPLESGGGTRLKILEAFSAGVPVVSTPVGCEGIAASDPEHLFVAARHEFVEAIARVLEQPGEARVRAERARLVARREYDWTVAGDRAANAIARAVDMGSPTSAPADLAVRAGAATE